jgi:phospholipid-binding lipoprotein MlaA
MMVALTSVAAQPAEDCSLGAEHGSASVLKCHHPAASGVRLIAADNLVTDADVTEQDAPIVGTADTTREGADPLRDLNSQAFDVVASIDEAVTGPVSRACQASVPAPLRSGLRDALGNLQEPVVALNFLLQLKPGKSVETLGRFALNSTVGLAGLVDVAKRPPFHLPGRANGFANTLGFYGVAPGAYLYLPMIGPTTVRDLSGRLIDLSVLPMAVGRPFNDPAFVLPTTTARLLDERAEADEEIRSIREGPDPYSSVRRRHLGARQAEIDALRGRGDATTVYRLNQPLRPPS